MKSAPFISIKRFAVHDGPGIRTTLFLKGCSLHCLWCHNPESISPRPQLAIHYAKCRLCGECRKICPNHQIVNAEHRFDRGKCTACGKCVSACIRGALELFGKPLSTQEAAHILLEDRIFYGDGGGITLSGGEPLLHSGFCAELMEKMKQEKIHCAVDTCGNVAWSAFEEVLPSADLFLYDFKCADSAIHKELTGCGNELILENLTKLGKTGKPIEIRMILVPRHNMAPELIHRAGIFLSRVQNITCVRLLAYHALAHSKFEAAGVPDTMPDVPSPTAEEVDFAAAILRRYGLHTVHSLKQLPLR